MFSKHSLSFSAFDDLITGTAFALLSEICFLENLTAFLTWESQLCLQAGITTGFFPLSPMFCCLFTATVGVKICPHHAACWQKGLRSCITWSNSLNKKGRNGGPNKKKGRERKQKASESLFLYMCVCVHIYTHTHGVGTALRCLTALQYTLRFRNVCLAWHEKPRIPSSWTSLSQDSGTKFPFLAKARFRSDSKQGDLFLARDVNAVFPALQVLTRMARYLCCCSHDLRPERRHGTEHRQKPEDNEHSRGLNPSQSFILNQQCS